MWFPKIVEVTGPTTFRLDAGGGGTDQKRGDVFAAITDGGASAESAEIEIAPGVAYEYMMELANQVDADPWFCIPHLADDDFVRNLATLVATMTTRPNTTVYVELSNEMWNSMFRQTWHAWAMTRELDLLYSSTYVGLRSSQIFAIFQEVFETFGETAPKLHRVLGTQSVNSWITEQVILGAGGAGSFDSVASAPYFAAKPKDVFALSTDGISVDGVTVDDVLELCLQDIFTGNRNDVMKQKQMAEKYGGILVAYEGGQHLGGQGPDPRTGKNGMENDADYQELMIATNRDPRMHNVYQAYFKQWGELNPGSVFAHFSFIGRSSKWGSWGVKETYFQNDTVEESPKWMSVNGIAQHCQTNTIIT
jgi:hypothetical protein